MTRLLSESPLEAVRRRATRGLQVRASRQEVARGEQFDAVVTVSEANLADLEVVVRTGYFDTQTYGEHGPTRTIRDYDALEVSEILPVLPELYDHELELVEQRERAGKRRAPHPTAIDELR